MPGLDFDPSGDWLVSFFDRSSDPDNILYLESWVRLNSDGTGKNPPEGGPISGAIPTNPDDNQNTRFVGDYQEVWWWELQDQYGGRFFLCFPQGDNQGDIYLSAAQ